MRTTVTLDPDVERLLKNAAHKRGKSFKVVLNEAVRHSLGSKRLSAMPVLHPPVALGLRPGLDPLRLNQMVDELEIEAFLSSKLEQKKARKITSHGHS